MAASDRTEALPRRRGVFLFAKRTLDMCLSLAASLFLVPLGLLIAVMIKLTSRGPVFFTEMRLGKGGRPFRIFKFRTMSRDARERLEQIFTESPELRDEWERNRKLRNDPRVTPLGRILRKTSLDEIPQLLNVFRGEMALVGPRPVVEAEKHLYGDDFDTAFGVRPGITGLWQVSGRSDTTYAQRVEMDVFYALNCSLRLDASILVRTAMKVLFCRGAR